MKRIFLAILLFAPFLWFGCNRDAGGLNESHFRDYLGTLASDDFQGRKPFTAGENKTVTYLEQTAKSIGLSPGNESSYFQHVPMVEITGKPSPVLLMEGAAQVAIQYGSQFVVTSQYQDPEQELYQNDVVFCGYGIVAPEYNWNDYAGVDVRRKTVIVLVNDPGLGNADTTLFKGKAMTYYGRWTYKYEEAARQGAAAVFIVHETSMAGYPWSVVEHGFSGSKLQLENLPYQPCPFEGWIGIDAVREIFRSADMDFQDAMLAARQPGFKAMPLPVKASVSIRNEVKRSTSKNVIATIPGTDQKEEYIILTAHWDHMGIGQPVNGDSIYNGACDNASGCAALLSIAENMVRHGPYKRTVVFLWVTAEEQGLLGSAYYGANPIFPPEKTVANLNIDNLYPFGKMKDVSIIGYGQSTLEDYADKWAVKMGRYTMPDPKPEEGSFVRSDHFNFAKMGVPAFYAKGSHDHAEKGTSYAAQKVAEFRSSVYHQPADEYHGKDTDVSGMLQDAELYLHMTEDLANSQDWPEWKAGSEFRNLRSRK